jgi:hypothetical protein
MVTLNDALLELVDGKLIEPGEGYTKAVDKTMYLAAIRSRGLDASFADADPAGAKEPAKPVAPPAGAKR